MQMQLEFFDRPTIRHQDLLDAIGPVRDLMRNEFPTGQQGMVIEDLDMIIRVFSDNFGTDEEGRLVLLEWKFGTAKIDTAQIKTFSLMDKMMRNGDKQGRYAGFWLVNYTVNDGIVEFLKARRKYLAQGTSEVVGHDAIHTMLRCFTFPEPVADLWDAA